MQLNLSIAIAYDQIHVDDTIDFFKSFFFNGKMSVSGETISTFRLSQFWGVLQFN